VRWGDYLGTGLCLGATGPTLFCRGIQTFADGQCETEYEKKKVKTKECQEIKTGKQ
jgi:hypothetical protein